ncbi:hypothetical protein L7F22_044342 [Adiantum nelumboides]|nr:hypothetical protein [Adiantum nelumboides]
MYAIIAKPLYALITKFEWTDECEKAFQILKQRLISAPILKAPDWDKVFHIHIDASTFAIGCILAQPGEKNMDFPINYSSRQLNSAEKNYTTTEREGLGMIYVVKKFIHYLLSNKFVFFTAAGSQASLIQHARFLPKAVKTTTTAPSSRTTSSTKKSSSDDERTDTDKDHSEKFDRGEDSQKGAEAKGPSEHELSDQEDNFTPLDRKNNKPKTAEQIYY